MGRSRVLAVVGLVAVAGAVGASFALNGSDATSESGANTPTEIDASSTTIAIPDLPDRGVHPELIDIDELVTTLTRWTTS